MANPGSPTSGRKPYGDPWQAFGYLVAGVMFYGFLGWLLDRWLDTGLFVVAGILFGAGLGIYMTFGRFGRGGADEGHHQAAGTYPEPDERKERM